MIASFVWAASIPPTADGGQPALREPRALKSDGPSDILAAVNFDWTEDEKAFQKEVRSFLRETRSPDVMDPTREGMAQLVDTPERRGFMKQMADRGYIGMSWPKEYGGGEQPGVYEYLLNEELASVGAPLIGKGVGIVGKTIIRHGNERLKQEFLPKILHAEIEFAIGYSEPDAGSDLAALKCRATKVDGGWSITGQKRFTTSAHFADWYWLAARTDPEAPKHKGITLFLVPMDAEGITVQAMDTIGDNEITNEVFLENVFVPDDYVVGEPNKGFYYVSEATQVEVARMHCIRVITKAAAGEVPNLESAMFKLWTTTIGQRLADEFLTITGAQGALRRGAPHAPVDGRFEHIYRYSVIDTVGAGTSEVQRNIIARRGLGLPVQS
jgi:alkylation response protein AidB-like acyl-CoA dehydrogenase